MKPRKTRKQSKSADQVGRDLDIIEEIRGQRVPKELTIETFTPMETSYAQMVKGQSDGEQIADISTKEAVTYMSGNPAVQTVTGNSTFSIVLSQDISRYYPSLPYRLWLRRFGYWTVQNAFDGSCTRRHN